MRKYIPWGIAVEAVLLLALILYGIVQAEDWEFASKAVLAGETESESSGEKDYIHWVEFNVTCEAMDKAFHYDLETYGQEIHLNWIELLAYLGAKYGGDFTKYKASDMEKAADAITGGQETMASLTENMKYYNYYYEAYSAVLGGMVGEYEIETVGSVGSDASGAKDAEAAGIISDGDNAGGDNTETASTVWKTKYGLKAFSPIAKGFPYSDYDDFGASRTYGYRRNHLGHDMMGQVGTPVIAVESGYVYVLGWNQYGGWRIGINSFDGKRYYYYAHLRKDRPYAENLKEGDIVQAGDVIGYMGRTGYSTTENVNNIKVNHLHFGLQLIFDESQREGNNEIWVSGYELTKFLSRNRSAVVRNDETKEWSRQYQIKDPAAQSFNPDAVQSSSDK